MNNEGRKEIRSLVKRLDGALDTLNGTDYEGMTHKEALTLIASVWDTVVEDVQSDIENLASEEHDKFYNMSEGLQQSDKGQAISDAADALDNAHDACNDVQGECDEVTSFVDQVVDKDDTCNHEDVADLAGDIANKIQDVIDYLEEAHG